VIVRLFKNLSDTRWFAAILLLFVLFIPFNYIFSLHEYSHTLLTNLHISSWFIYQQTPINTISIIVLTIAAAIFFHHVLINNKLTSAKNFTGLLFTVILIVVWHPILVSYLHFFTLALVLFGLFRLLFFDESPNPLLQIFDSAFLISLAVILNIFLIPLILLPFVALIHFRDFNLRTWVAAITGIILPILFLNTADYLLNDQITFFTLISDSLALISTSFIHLKAYPYHWIGAGLVVVPAIIKTLSKTREKKIAIRKQTTLLIWFFILSFSISLFENAPIDIIIYLIAFPAGFFISSSLYFLHEKKLFAILIDLGCIALIVFHSFF